jgi:hypothetical protein
MTVAEENLSLEELGIAIQLQEPESTSISDLDINLDEFRLRVEQLCRSFVRIADDRVYFIHQTAKEYLISTKTRRTSQSTSDYRPVCQLSVQATACHTLMAIACIRYLLLNCFMTLPDFAKPLWSTSNGNPAQFTHPSPCFVRRQRHKVTGLQVHA